MYSPPFVSHYYYIIAFITIYDTIPLEYCSNLFRMRVTFSQSIDYQKKISLLLREKLPSFLFGLCVLLIAAATLFKKQVFQSVLPVRPLISTQKVSQIREQQTYTVQSGDDLWSISEKFFGSGLNAYDIAKANKLREPYILNENQILIIPKVNSSSPTRGEITQEAAQTKRITEYEVGEGEYLWQIAELVYGDGNQMGKIIEANRIPYPYNVERGQKLIIPR